MTLSLAIATLILTAAAQATGPKLNVRISQQIVSTWRCQDRIGVARTLPSVDPYKTKAGDAYKRWLLNLWADRRKACTAELSRVSSINRNLFKIAVCETGGKPGQNGLPDWDHRARSEHAGHYYEGSLGFLDSTWDGYKPAGYPDGAHQASAAQQMAVGRRLVEEFGNYSSWPSCSRRLGLR